MTCRKRSATRLPVRAIAKDSLHPTTRCQLRRGWTLDVRNNPVAVYDSSLEDRQERTLRGLNAETTSLACPGGATARHANGACHARTPCRRNPVDRRRASRSSSRSPRAVDCAQRPNGGVRLPPPPRWLIAHQHGTVGPAGAASPPGLCAWHQPSRTRPVSWHGL